MWASHHGFWCFPFLFFMLVICFAVVRPLILGRYRGCRRSEMDEALIILRKRLVNGEIDEGEYQKLKDVLKK
jgi:uncharacterized membrane protein